MTSRQGSSTSLAIDRNAERAHSIPDADEIRQSADRSVALDRDNSACASRNFAPSSMPLPACLLIVMPVNVDKPCIAPPQRSAVRTDFAASLSALDALAGTRTTFATPVVARNSAKGQHASRTANRIGTAAESEHEDPVARFVEFRSMQHSSPGCSCEIPTARGPCSRGRRPSRQHSVLCSAPRPLVIEDDLLTGRRLRRVAVGTASTTLLLSSSFGKLASLPSAVRKDHNVLRHAAASPDEERTRWPEDTTLGCLGVTCPAGAARATRSARPKCDNPRLVPDQGRIA